MTIALADNPEHIQRLCYDLDLGAYRGQLSRVYGGFHHRMWRLDTQGGSYAIKQLSPDTDCTHSETRGRYNATESAADEFLRHGIPALVALRSSQGYLQVLEESGYLVYPWTDAVAQGKNTIGPEQSQCVAAIMARMHSAGVNLPGLGSTKFDVNSEEKVAALVEWAIQRNVRDARELQSRLPGMLEVVRLQEQSIQILSKQQVISHGDLDHKNVLWTEGGEPLLIDWESVRWLNPTYELLLEALDWSGITGNFTPSAFAAFLEAYRRAGGVIDTDAVNAAINCVFGDWLNWLMYNVGRAMDIDSPEEHSTGSNQVDLAFTTLLRLEKHLPRLLDIAQQQASQEACHV